ncbi:MAG: class I SAM-dependent methyltransferase, partial [Flavobacteriales bacterium]|nr:class I SAM-dependent methyltransferase [Flavobacteriales bacterium]
MTNSNESVSTFYDSYGEADFKKGCNERHLFLYDKLVEFGLKDDSSLLELGCGVGIITKLISRKITTGKIITSDISDQSIEISKRHNKEENIEFIVSDIVKFKRENDQFDYITLFDILEHVP